jgi:tryptophan halogenase
MKPLENAIEKIVIVGGGTAGWIAAATIGNIFKNTNLKIELVESDDIGVIGVGEATIPPLINILESLGIDLIDFIKKTQASFKLGIKFEDWKNIGESYFHPFGTVGRDIDGYNFYQCWLKCQAEGDKTPLMAHSPESVLSEQGKFFFPHKVQNTPLARAFYALHLDSVLAGKYLRNYAENLGVIRTEGMVEQITQHENGNIASVVLKDGQTLCADFFIDCSGFKGLLIEETLKTGYESWADYLPCNKAVTVQTKNVGDTPPYTTSKAQEAGWMWKIPLQHRTGNGYVFCDKYITDEQAKKTLLDNIEGEPIMEPRIIPFTTGVRKKAWVKNCLSLGLAQGFIEPLESTAIHLVSKTIAFFIRSFPTKSCEQVLIDQFNRSVRTDYEEIRDFLVLHYCKTSRTDSEFWRWCQSMNIPPTLKHKIDLFQASGGLSVRDEELFQPTSWYAVFDGLGVKPDTYNPTLDAWDADKLKGILAKGQQGLFDMTQQQPSHDEFIKEFCKAPKIN